MLEIVKSFVEHVDWLRAVDDAEFAGEVKLSFLFLGRAQQHLFSKIGLGYPQENVKWYRDEVGHPVTFDGIQLCCRTLARMGYLWLNNGSWAGEQMKRIHSSQSKLMKWVQHKRSVPAVKFWARVMVVKTRSTRSEVRMKTRKRRTTT